MWSDQACDVKWLYVRNNPVRHGLVKDPDDWPFQSVMNDLGLKTSVRADDRELDPSLRIWPFPGVASDAPSASGAAPPFRNPQFIGYGVMNDLGLKRASERVVGSIPRYAYGPFPGVAPVRRSISAKLEMMTSRLCSSGNQLA